MLICKKMARKATCSGMLLLLFSLPLQRGRALDLAWEYPTGGKIIARPVSDEEGRIFFLSEDRRFYVLSREGKPLLSRSTRERFAHSFARGGDGTLYAGTKEGTLVALNRRGQSIWRYQASAPLAGDPLVLKDGTIIFADRRGRVYALSHVGKLIWTRTFSAPIEVASTLSEGGLILCPVTDGRLYALFPEGSLAWGRPLGGPPTTPALLPGGDIVVSTRSGVVVRLDERSGRLLWSYALGGPSSSPVVSDDAVFLSTPGGDVFTLALDGTLLWRRSFASRWVGSPIVTERTLLLLSMRGEIFRISHTGEKEEVFRGRGIPGQSLLFSAGMLLGGRDNWSLYAHKVERWGKLSPWTQVGFDHNHRGWRGDATRESLHRRVIETTHFAALGALVKSDSYALKCEALKQIKEELAGNLGALKRFANLSFLQKLASEGTFTRTLSAGGALTNNYVDLRREAYVLLGQHGDLATREFLLTAARVESDVAMLRELILALGTLASDLDGQVGRLFLEIFERNKRGQRSSLVPALLAASERILRYNGEAGSGLRQMLSRAVEGRTTEANRRHALSLLRSMM